MKLRNYFVLFFVISLSLVHSYNAKTVIFSQKTFSLQKPISPLLEMFMRVVDPDGDGVHGSAGHDYPTFHRTPVTSFTCSGRIDGFYADIETGCQVFHICSANQKTSFLCGNGTIFDQKLFTCNWWYRTSCIDSPNHFALNAKLYKQNETMFSDKTEDHSVNVNAKVSTTNMLKSAQLAAPSDRAHHDVPQDNSEMLRLRLANLPIASFLKKHHLVLTNIEPSKTTFARHQ